MTDKKLAILAIAAVVMAGWAVLQHRLSERTATRQTVFRMPLIQGLDPEAIAEIKLISGGDSVTLKRSGGRFSVVEKDGYPANISAVNRLLSNCLDIRITEHITANPENHSDLGVTEQTAQHRVRFYDTDGEEITGVMLSARQSDPDGVFARLTTEDDTYFIQNPPFFSANVMRYIDTTLIDVNRDQIRRVEIDGPDGHYVLASDDDQQIVLESMPDDMQFKGTTYRTVFAALTALRFDDVMAAENAPADLTFDHRYVCQLDDTTVYTVKLARDQDKTYAAVTAAFLDTSPVYVDREDSPEQLRQKEARLLAMDAAEDFARRHRRWVYVLPASKADDLTTPRDALLEEKPESEPAEEAEPTAQEAQL